MDELLKCPFCGGEVVAGPEEMSPFENYSYKVFSVRCSVCHVGFSKDTEQEAITAWNNRADGWTSDRLPKEGE